jgi:hypothetical protein
MLLINYSYYIIFENSTILALMVYSLVRALKSTM